MSFQPQSLDLPSLKRLARHFQQAWKADHAKHGDRPPSLSRAQELLARTFGFTDWHSAQQALAIPSASAKEVPVTPVPSADQVAWWTEQIQAHNIRTFQRDLHALRDTSAYKISSKTSSGGVREFTLRRTDVAMWEAAGREAMRHQQWPLAALFALFVQQDHFPVPWEHLDELINRAERRCQREEGVGVSEMLDVLTLMAALGTSEARELLDLMALAHQSDHRGVGAIVQLLWWCMPSHAPSPDDLRHALATLLTSEDKLAGMIMHGSQMKWHDNPKPVLEQVIQRLNQAGMRLSSDELATATILNDLPQRVSSSLAQGARQGSGRFSLGPSSASSVNEKEA